MTTLINNEIAEKQRKSEFIALLRARFVISSRAKSTQGWFIVLTVALPVLSLLLAPHYPDLKPYFALAALTVLLLDTAVVERIQKDRTKRSAKLQEEFDTKILGMPWNRFVVGAPVDPEDIREASGKVLSKEREAGFLDWYETCVSDVPLRFARLICQRTNLSYDARIRKRYGGWLLALAVILAVGLVASGIALKLKLPELLLSVITPVMPIFNWAIREHRKQIDTANTLVTLKTECEKLWDKALAGASEQDLVKGSRELQDAIYQHRASSPLVFDWIYRRLRTKNEDAARHAAEKLVGQVKEMQMKEMKV
ncbi:S-4TM family putative pore-forming effector [Pseudoduganella sp. RAF53_2]|uniref:S-4TM family putative pore-forming effector n=1 Tax=Pseudoduganella sp. RAF53_2 TaxID=3233060 RepID=UPI003F99C86B